MSHTRRVYRQNKSHLQKLVKLINFDIEYEYFRIRKVEKPCNNLKIFL